MVRWFRRKRAEQEPPAEPPVQVRVEVHYGSSAEIPDDLNWASAGQETPVGYYVYAHLRSDGTPFYIGKGSGDRAWSAERQHVWHRFVDQRLDGTFEVAILRDGMAEADALALETALINRYGEQLVNWQNPRRAIDYDAVATSNQLRKRSQELTEQAKQTAKDDPAARIALAREALDLVHQYAPIQLETGLVEDLRDRRNGDPTVGDPNVIYRLALCLKAAGRWAEIVDEVDGYLQRYPDARDWRAMESAIKLRDRAEAKASDASSG